MPFYNYQCLDCKEDFTVMHMMSEEWDNCELCGSKNITKKISGIGAKVNQDKFKKKDGDLVKSHIEEAKREIKKEKNKMKGEMFKDD